RRERAASPSSDVDIDDVDRGRQGRHRRLPREAGAPLDGAVAVADQPELHNWKPLLEDLGQRRQRALEMGGAQQVERQRSLGKTPVRERLDMLLDPGSWVEYGQLA